MVKDCSFLSVLNGCCEALDFCVNDKGMVYASDVRAVLKQYPGIVFSELDKNINSWSLMCEGTLSSQIGSSASALLAPKGARVLCTCDPQVPST